MRYLLITLMVAMLTVTAFADDYTLLGKDIHHGGYGGPVLKLTSIAGSSEAFVGFKGGWIIDHTFVIGLAGYSMVSDRSFNGDYTPDRFFYDPLNIEYGGLYLEYIITRKHPVHFSVDLLIGSGRIFYDYGDNHFGGEYFGRGSYYEDEFLVIEPGVNLMLKLTDFLRLGVGISYRDVQNVQFFEYDEDDLSEASMNFCFKFGKF